MAHSHKLLLFKLLAVLLLGISEAGLSYNHYDSTCPNVENLVKAALVPIFLTDVTAPAAFLRLMFHDCQVQVFLFDEKEVNSELALTSPCVFTQGCDASVLLDSDGQTINSEMLSGKNFGVRNRESIQQIKSVLEGECPGQVSCADIIALVAKESVAFSGGPHIRIPLGRKDSTTCSNKRADANIPSASISVDQLLQIFMAKGMTVEESVAILGAHTLGAGHCINIVDRLYNPKPVERMHYGFELFLRTKCPTEIPLTNTTVIFNDLTTLKFDNQYFRDVMHGMGLFSIDSTISMDPRTANIVGEFAIDEIYFFQVFSSAFVKLSSAEVLTGESGQIRRVCNRVN